MNSEKIKILFIEDDIIDQKALQRSMLRENRFHYDIAPSLTESHNFMESNNYDIIISDYELGDGTALELLKQIKIPIIVVTGAGDEEIAVKVMKLGAYDYIVKDAERNYLKLLPVIIIKTITGIRTQEENNLLTHAISNTYDAIFIIDNNNKIIFINNSFSLMYDYKKDEILGKDGSILWVDKEDFLMNFSFQKELQSEFIHKRKDGQHLNVDLAKSIIYNNKKNENACVVVIRDITKKKMIELKQKENEIRFRNFYEYSSFGIYQCTLDGKLLMTNPALVEMLGFTSENDLLQKNISDFYINKADRKEFLRILTAEGIVYDFEKKWKRKDEKEIFVKASARIVKNENHVYYEGNIEDITFRKEYEKALITTMEKAEKANKLKTEFLSQLSHEVRTPLNVMQTWINVIKEEASNLVDDDLKEGFDIINIEAKRLRRMFELSVNMSEMLVGSYEKNPKLINLYKDILIKLNTEFRDYALKNKIDFNIICDNETTELYADEWSVYRIFEQLIDNAFKYTRKGKIEVIVKHNLQNLSVSIIDTGIGISEEYLPDLFTYFSQEDHGYSRSYDGNGLGLALVKQYCDLNNATVSVESQKGKGSKFTVTFDENL